MGRLAFPVVQGVGPAAMTVSSSTRIGAAFATMIGWGPRGPVGGLATPGAEVATGPAEAGLLAALDTTGGRGLSCPVVLPGAFALPVALGGFAVAVALGGFAVAVPLGGFALVRADGTTPTGEGALGPAGETAPGKAVGAIAAMGALAGAAPDCPTPAPLPLGATADFLAAGEGGRFTSDRYAYISQDLNVVQRD